MPHVKKSATLDIRIDPDLKAAAQAMADADLRPLSNFIVWLIVQERKRREEAVRG